MSLSAEDRAAIHDVIALHGHLTDDGELDRYGEVFSQDIAYDVSALGFGELRGLDALREAALALGPGNPVGHHVSNILVTATDDPNTAHARSKGTGIMADGTCGSVVYEDVLRRGSEGWRITRRAVRPRRAPLIR
uniref:nuclear transport factor 2 family protein n=1 Tax=Pseudonocardia sp. CA-138482 TaxID=3240023 RepID=UPI003F499E89